MPMLTIGSYARGKQGFTLIELLVVISIIGLLATLSVVALNSARARGRDAKRLSDMQGVSTAMQIYYDANGASFVGGCRDATGVAVAVYPARVVSCVGLATGTAITKGIAYTLTNIASIVDPSSTTACAAAPTAVCDYAFRAAPTATGFNVDFYQEGGDGAGLVTENGVTK